MGKEKKLISNKIAKGGVKRKNPRNLFSEEDDEKLIKLHNIYGDNWDFISKKMGGSRSRTTCSWRYTNYLIPGIYHGTLSAELKHDIINIRDNVPPSISTIWLWVQSQINNKYNIKISLARLKNTWHAAKRTYRMRKKCNVDDANVDANVDDANVDDADFDDADYADFDFDADFNFDGNVADVDVADDNVDVADVDVADDNVEANDVINCAIESILWWTDNSVENISNVVENVVIGNVVENVVIGNDVGHGVGELDIIYKDLTYCPPSYEELEIPDEELEISDN